MAITTESLIKKKKKLFKHEHGGGLIARIISSSLYYTEVKQQFQWEQSCWSLFLANESKSAVIFVEVILRVDLRCWSELGTVTRFVGVHNAERLLTHTS